MSPTSTDTNDSRQNKRLRSYVPYVTAVIAALVIVTIPSPDRADRSQGAGSTPGTTVTAVSAATGAGAGGTEGAPATGVPASSVPQSPSTAPIGVQPPRAASAAPAAASAPNSRPSGTNAAAAAQSYPGIGSQEALAGPNCDAARQRIKFPSNWAPPCVRPWIAGTDNGGATAQGITADSIRVVWWLSNTSNDDADAKTKKQAIDSFNIWQNHYEMYGRRLDIRFHKATGSDEIAQRSDAIKVASLKPFLAVIPLGLAPPSTYSAELAARGVITIDPSVLWKDTQAQPGYRWGMNMDDGMHASMVGEWVGKRINGGLAKWAGDPAMTVKTRVFGLLHPEGWEKSFFDRQAAGYGVQLADVLTYKEGADATTLQERARTHIARLKDKSVTSVIAVTDYLYTVLLTREATLQQYSPEWVITGWNLQDLILFSRLYDQQQWSHAFGMGLVNLLPPPEQWEQNMIYRWEYSRDPDDSAVNGNVYLVSRDVMAAIHLAGPTLTPATFKQGMFAKPPAGGPWNGPTTTGTSYGRKWLGLAWDDYSSLDGMNETWWDPATITKEEAFYTEAPGAYFRLNGGKQYQIGKLQTGEPKMFDKNAATYTVAKNAPEDEPPKYPHTPHQG